MAAAFSAVGMAAVYALSIWRTTLARDEQYCIRTADLKLVQKTTWMTPEIAGEIQASLRQLPPRLSLMDRTTSELVAKCLEKNPWIREVYHVRLDSPKLGGRSNGLEVSMAFRRPIAFVEVGRGSGARYIMVDRQGVRLGADSYEDPELGDRRLLTIVGVETEAPVAGRLWSDPAVLAGAQVADLLRSRVARFNLYRIDVSNVEKRRDPRKKEIVLYTKRSRTCILWGRPPGRKAELLENITAAGKIQLLDRAFDRYGGLHGRVEAIDLVERKIRRSSSPERRRPTVRG
ncbi:MAG: hypothetical protein GWP05_04935 [Anaerolineaceae bacterium]|nr:hypothetical protein [Anaerolineaceae bacterium]